MARYWLAQCEGFRVKGPTSGTVEEVVGSADLKSAQSLVVRTRGRRRSIPVDAVDVVVPASRLIVVEAERAEPTSAPSHRAADTVAVVGSRAGRLVRAAALALLAVGTGVAHRLAAGVARVRAAVYAWRLAEGERRRQRYEQYMRRSEAAAERSRSTSPPLRPPARQRAARRR